VLQACEQRRCFTRAQAAALVERAALQPGERVLDLAAGTGWVTLPAAHRVGPAGSVLGIDLTDAMLAVVRGGPDPTPDPILAVVRGGPTPTLPRGLLSCAAARPRPPRA